jgi:predicted nucleic acid-binding protein
LDYLLDTNILSEWSRPKPDPGVIGWLRTLDNLIISGMTLLEIRFGLLLHKSPYQERWFKNLKPALHILPAWDTVFVDSAKLLEVVKSRSVTANPADMIIASFARRYQLVLATRNTKDFLHSGVELYSPFTS